jgi:oligoendopeptidase F
MPVVYFCINKISVMANFNAKNSIRLFLMLLLLNIIMSDAQSQMTRTDIDEKYKWDLTDIFSSDEVWETELQKIPALAEKLTLYKGKLGSSAKTLYSFLSERDELHHKTAKLGEYAFSKSDEDLKDNTYQALKQTFSQVMAGVMSKLSFIQPELSTIPVETVKGFMKEIPGFDKYQMYFDNLWRQKERILSDKEERIIAEASQLMRAPYDNYGVFTNAEMPFPTVTLSNGEEVYLDKSAYGKYRTTENLADREIVFKAFWKSFQDYKNTLAQDLYANVNTNIFVKNVRNYSSTLHSALDDNKIPVEVYHALIENVNKNLPTFHRLLKIKKQLLGVDTLKYSDMYMSGVKGVDLDYTYEQGTELLLEAVKPMGEEYYNAVKESITDRWIDVYPSKGKRSGAYCTGSSYDVHPYILLNYNGQYEDVSTLAHEMGHAMHSYFSNKYQPFVSADYSIFVAEVASTLNERLLEEVMLNKIKDDDVKLSLLMTILDGYRTTLFRQTQFAEFELKINQQVESGKPLTADILDEIYMDILKRYYGHDEGVSVIEDLYAVEWAYIPHFYYNYYVYQYSTSFSASIALSQDIINKQNGAVDRYIEFISSGSSKYPIDLLKQTGADMTSEIPFDKTMAAMNRLMDEVERIIVKKKR